MDIVQLGVLALVQGITEFLPISSSGHLILVPALTGWPDQGPVIDVAVHVGTLAAVLLYLWRDCAAMLGDLTLVLLRRRPGPGARLAGLLVLATLPTIIAGWLIHRHASETLRSAEVIAWATIGFGVLLYLADRIGMRVRRLEHMSVGSALAIGLAQCLAFIPGTSRAGVTMTAARFLGFERAESARFSMLLSIPTILGAGLLIALDLYEVGDTALGRDALVAAALACASALAAIALMMAWLRRASFTPFVVYRILLGAALLTWIYWPAGSSLD